MSFEDSSLSKPHQELLALALSKTYSGVPVCSITFALDAEGIDSDPDQQEARWKVLKSGGIAHESTRKRGNYRDTPISYVPEDPFELASGEVVKETKTDATFRFHFKPSSKFISIDNDELNVALQFDWFAELTVDIIKKAPKKLLLSIAEGGRRAQSPLVSVHVAKVSFSYKYNDSCKYWATYSKLRHFEGSSLFSGKFLNKTTTTFTNVTCTQPAEYLLLEKNELDFIDLL